MLNSISEEMKEEIFRLFSTPDIEAVDIPTQINKKFNSNLGLFYLKSSKKLDIFLV